MHSFRRGSSSAAKCGAAAAARLSNLVVCGLCKEETPSGCSRCAECGNYLAAAAAPSATPRGSQSLKVVSRQSSSKSPFAASSFVASSDDSDESQSDDPDESKLAAEDSSDSSDFVPVPSPREKKKVNPTPGTKPCVGMLFYPTPDVTAMSAAVAHIEHYEKTGDSSHAKFEHVTRVKHVGDFTGLGGNKSILVCECSMFRKSDAGHCTKRYDLRRNLKSKIVSIELIDGEHIDCRSVGKLPRQILLQTVPAVKQLLSNSTSSTDMPANKTIKGAAHSQNLSPSKSAVSRLKSDKRAEMKQNKAESYQDVNWYASTFVQQNLGSMAFVLHRRAANAADDDEGGNAKEKTDDLPLYARYYSMETNEHGRSVLVVDGDDPPEGAVVVGGGVVSYLAKL